MVVPCKDPTVSNEKRGNKQPVTGLEKKLPEPCINKRGGCHWRFYEVIRGGYNDAGQSNTEKTWVYQCI